MVMISLERIFFSKNSFYLFFNYDSNSVFSDAFSRFPPEVPPGPHAAMRGPTDANHCVGTWRNRQF